MKNWTFAVLLGLCSLTGLNLAHAEVDIDPDSDAEFRDYCDQTMRGLERARWAAERAISRGDFAQALSLLLEGLRASSSYQYGDLNPVALNLVGHASALGIRLEQEVGSSIKGIKSVVIAMEGFYDLIFQTVRKIDLQYYHCGSHRRNCRYSRTLEFEQNMAEMATGMLTLVNSNLVAHRSGQVFPLGSSTSYLVASEMVAMAAYTELAQLLYGPADACEILDLKYLGLELQTFNRSSSSEMMKREKVYQVYDELNYVIASLRSSRRCR